MNTTYNILIVDDEPYAHNLLESYCDKLDYVKIIGNCYNGIEALNEINKQPVDIILLDIQMPEISGIELLDTIQKEDIKVIMVTAYSDSAIETYNYDLVVDYLLKPIKFVRFVKALERVKKVIMLEKNETSQSFETNISSTNATCFCIKEGKTIHKITYESLLYIQSYGNYLKLFLIDGEMKIIRNTISKIDKELSVFEFCRIHKSYLVNLKHVSKIDGNRIQINDITLPLGSSYSHYFKEKFIRE
ncbi:LytTR family two component transcriptional regulator [Aquimarina sp. MAR_2010_214]|uniref:LytR/AlgR family response regulator transcription factor n=1 Tax=Aquimarina sp. MAR_2010_214 TaxID=1250026 RepID=UPI000C712F05|nr:LytTR family DNA-binding domain-containing protein [Aquimarina sp. MAR_2010_214]PKV52834.1 LytTR family two component transcriptional regulator [Aquimarina sp. MAR_2010_214]